jgi:hypothetical protein
VPASGPNVKVCCPMGSAAQDGIGVGPSGGRPHLIAIETTASSDRRLLPPVGEQVWTGPHDVATHKGLRSITWHLRANLLRDSLTHLGRLVRLYR